MTSQVKDHVAPTVEEKRNELLAQKLIKNLNRRHMEAFYCKTGEDAVKKVSELIADGSTVTWGGTATVRDLGIPAMLYVSTQDSFHIPAGIATHGLELVDSHNARLIGLADVMEDLIKGCSRLANVTNLNIPRRIADSIETDACT